MCLSNFSSGMVVTIKSIEIWNALVVMHLLVRTWTKVDECSKAWKTLMGQIHVVFFEVRIVFYSKFQKLY